MKTATLIIAFLFFAPLVYSQNESANWCLIYNKLILKITSHSTKIDTLSSMATGFLSNASIGDSSGNLLFFSFGVDVRDKNGDIMDNGCCLCESIDLPGNCFAGNAGSPHFQGSLILPKPGTSDQYYLVIRDMDISPNGQPTRVHVSEVDMLQNGGLGKVTQRIKPILSDTLSDSRMTAVRHANGRDWWLVNHEYNTNKIYTHLITPDSIYGPFEQKIGYAGKEPDAFGWSLFCGDGSLFATVTAGMNGITLLDFDRCTGTFSNFRSLDFNADSNVLYFNLAISPNGRFLYAANAIELCQYDLWDTGFARSSLVIDTAPYPELGALVLMPDNKIYMAGWTVGGGVSVRG